MATQEQLDQLQAAATQIQGKIQELTDAFVDYRGDVKAAFDKLQEAIAAGTSGQNLDPFLASLAASVSAADEVLNSIKTADGEAEQVSGAPTPPVA